MENTNSYHNQTEATIPTKKHPNLISFPATESVPENFHSILRGGDSMEIKHKHPVYASEEERQARLLSLKRTCVAKLAARSKTPVKSA